MSYVAQLFQGANGAIHGVDSFKCHDFWDTLVDLGEKFFQMFRVVVLENVFRDSAVSYALDHRGMVSGVRKYVGS